MKQFWIGLAIAGAAPIILSVVSWAGWAVKHNYAFWLLWPLALLLFGPCLAIGIRASIFDSRRGRAGVLVGIGLAAVALGTTCFAIASVPKPNGP